MSEDAIRTEAHDEVPAPPPLHPLRVLSGAFSVLFVALFSLALLGMHLNTPPHTFPTGVAVHVVPGLTVDGIATTLKDANLVRSASLFKLMVVLSGSAQDLKAGTYRYRAPSTTWGVVASLVRGEYELQRAVVTIPEGARITEIDQIASDALDAVVQGSITALAADREGYLFPETYHVAPDTTVEELVTLMQDMHALRFSLLATTTTRTSAEIVTMASILEREGKTPESMHIISGILWKRLEIGMPLQVDATLEYERGLGSAELSLDDLRTDTPYNTYTRKGLPPTPISNPGSVALHAALTPTPSPYLFYLTGDDGMFYYAKNFEEHKRNKERHIR